MLHGKKLINMIFTSESKVSIGSSQTKIENYGQAEKVLCKTINNLLQLCPEFLIPSHELLKEYVIKKVKIFEKLETIRNTLSFTALAKFRYKIQCGGARKGI